MRISDKQLKRVRVETQSGRFVGNIVGFELETDSGLIEKYYVAPNKLTQVFFGTELIIARNQVISLDDEKMIIEDLLVKEKGGIKEAVKGLGNIEGASQVITSKES